MFAIPTLCTQKINFKKPSTVIYSIPTVRRQRQVDLKAGPFRVIGDTLSQKQKPELGPWLLFQRVQVPAPTQRVTDIVNFSPKGLDILFWPPSWLLKAHGAKTYMETKYPCTKFLNLKPSKCP